MKKIQLVPVTKHYKVAIRPTGVFLIDYNKKLARIRFLNRKWEDRDDSGGKLSKN